MSKNLKIIIGIVFLSLGILSLLFCIFCWVILFDIKTNIFAIVMVMVTSIITAILFALGIKILRPIREGPEIYDIEAQIKDEESKKESKEKKRDKKMLRFFKSIKKEFGRGKELKASFKSLAEKYNGEVKIRKIFGLELLYRPLKIPVPNGEATLTVSSGSDKAPPITKIEIKYNISTRIKFSIFTENLFTRIVAKLGMQDIRIDDPEFDKKFMLKSNDVHLFKEFMDKEVQQCVTDINELISGYRSHKSVSISWNKNKLIITKTGYISEEESLDTFINRAFRIYGKFILKLK